MHYKFFEETSRTASDGSRLDRFSAAPLGRSILLYHVLNIQGIEELIPKSLNSGIPQFVLIPESFSSEFLYSYIFLPLLLPFLLPLLLPFLLPLLVAVLLTGISPAIILPN